MTQNFKHPIPGQQLVDGGAVGAILGLSGFDFQGALTAAADGLAPDATKLIGGLNEVTTSAGAADSCILPPAAAGTIVFLANEGGNTVQVFAQGTDTINGTAGSTGVTQNDNVNTLYFCPRASKWYSTALT